MGPTISLPYGGSSSPRALSEAFRGNDLRVANSPKGVDPPEAVRQHMAEEARPERRRLAASVPDKDLRA